MKVVNRCVEALVQITFRKNICFRHTLEEMSKHNQYACNNFYIIDSFFSLPYCYVSIHYLLLILAFNTDTALLKYALG